MKMFFAKPGVYQPCGIFNLKHLCLFLVTITGVSFALKNTKTTNKNDIKKIIKITTIIVWILEILKIGFMCIIGEANNLNRVMPLYYCSLLLYAGILSSYGKGIFKKMGDVFLGTGGIIGGIVFLLFPTTSLPEFPLFHFISFHSFFFHGTMIYLGLLLYKSKYIELKFSDFKYYALLILLICLGAYAVNTRYDCNLMFISKDFPGTPISVLYKTTGKFFTIIMCLIQIIVPFYFIYVIQNIIHKCKKNKNKIENECEQLEKENNNESERIAFK